MARGRMIDKCISISEKINDLSLKEAFIYTWIIPHLDDWGRITGSPRKIKALVFPMKKEICTKDIEKAFEKFREMGLFLWEEVDGIMVLQQPFREFSMHQTISEKKRAKSKYPEIPKNSQEMPRKSCLKIREDKISKDKIREDNKIFLSEFSNENYGRLVFLLRDLILQNNPKAKITNSQLKNWYKEVQLMVERDNRTLEEIEFVITKSQNDSFWKGNILSMGKLREKFDQLWIKFKNENIGFKGRKLSEADKAFKKQLEEEGY